MEPLKLLKSDVERICRVCLEPKSELKGIFDEDAMEPGTSVSQILSECTQYRVEPQDALPQQICSLCTQFAIAAYRFKRQTEAAYRTLKALLECDEGWATGNHHNKTERPSKESTVPENCRSTQTESVSIHPCEQCHEKFFDVFELREHRLTEHRGTAKSCRVCGEQFENIRRLKSHLAMEHPEQGLSFDVQCTVCERQFSRKDHLKRHLRVTHKQVDNTLNKSLENTEMDTTTDKTRHNTAAIASTSHWFNCENMEEAPSFDLKCTVCERQFAGKEHLRRHMRHEHNQGRKIPKMLDEPEIHLKIDELSGQVAAPSSGSANWFNYENNDESDRGPRELRNTANPISCNDETLDAAPDADQILAQLKIEPNSFVKVELFDSEKPLEMTSNETVPLLNHTENTEETVFKEEESEDTDGTDGTDGTDDGDLDDISGYSSDSAKSNDDLVRPISPKPKVRIIREYLEKKDKDRQRRSRSRRVDADEDNRCTECQRTFSRRCHLQRHMLTHLSEKPFACKLCPKRFSRSDHLKKHVVNLHEDKQFGCDQCEHKFARADALARHKESKHSDNPNALKIHDCEYCAKKFTSKTYLTKHILMHTDRIFACKHCDATYKDRKDYREHEKTHSVRRNFLCSVCGESFVRNDYLRVHMRRHTGEKPFKCQYCGKGFPRPTDVKMHERYHTNTKPHICNLCGKAFHRAYNLTIHMRIHTGERPFKCDQCPKSFTQSNDLKAHKRRHTGELYKCNVCEAGFLQLYGLRQHLLSAHGIQVEASHGRVQKFDSSPANAPQSSAKEHEQQLTAATITTSESASVSEQTIDNAPSSSYIPTL